MLIRQGPSTQCLVIMPSLGKIEELDPILVARYVMFSGQKSSLTNTHTRWRVQQQDCIDKSTW